MASGFSDPDTKCQKCQSERTIQAMSFYATEKQTLCYECANAVHYSIDRCKKHQSRPAEVFCETEQVAICTVCSTTEHKLCETKDMCDVIKEYREKCQDLLRMVTEKESKIRDLLTRVSKQDSQVGTNVGQIKMEVEIASEQELKQAEENRMYIAEKIHYDAEEEIKTIIRERDEKLKRNTKENRERCLLIAKQRCEFINEVKWFEKMLQRETESINQKAHFLSRSLQKAKSGVKNLLGTDKTLLTGFHDVESALNKIDTSVDMTVLEQISQWSDTIAFQRKEGTTFGHLVKISGQWVTKASIDIHPFQPVLIADKQYVIVKDNESGSYSLVNYTTKQLQRKMIDGKTFHCVYSLASLDEERIACGTNDGYVVIYDTREWSPIKTIRVLTEDAPGPIIVAIDNQKLVLAAGQGASVIKVLNPDVGTTQESIAVANTAIIDLHTLSSGDMIIRTRCAQGDDISFVDRSTGSVKSTTHLHDKCLRSIASDPVSDVLYIRLWDPNIEACAVDVMTVVYGELIMTKRILQFPPLTKKWPLVSPDCFVPESGTLVLLRGNRLLIYEKVLPMVSMR